MELKKANLHMDRIKCQLNTQITLEEDKNISDRNPDALAILMEKGRVIIEEVRPAKGSLSLKGKMQYEVLYIGEEEEGRLYQIQGEIPWEEKIRVEEMDSMENPEVEAEIEDLRSSLINSRKINIRCLVNFKIKVKEIYDQEMVLDITEAENVEIKKEPHTQSVIAVDRKDVFRIKEELELPSSLPPIGEVIWKYLELGKWEIKPLEDSIGIQGEIRLFILYESAQIQPQLRSYETSIPFSGNIECGGSNSGMIADITPAVTYQNLGVKQDYDGEDRVLDVEMVLEIPICLYEQREVEAVTDIYGTACEMLPEYSEVTCKVLRDKYQGKVKVTKECRNPSLGGKILQVCHMNSHVWIEDSRVLEEGLKIEGILAVTVLYMTDDEKKPYEVLKKEIPFEYQMENMNLTPESKWKICPMAEQQDVVILDENSMEIKCLICLEVLVEDNCTGRSVSNVTSLPFTEEKIEETPGMVIYIPAEKENIWNIGKKYSVSQDSVRQLNKLSNDEVEKGQKLLLVRGYL